MLYDACNFAGWEIDALSSWPTTFEVWPSENGIMKAEPVGTQIGLSALGFEDIIERKESHAKKLELTLQAISGSVSQVIMDGCYVEKVPVIEFLAKFAAGTEEKIDYWKKELLRNLLEKEELERIDTWIQNSNGIKALITAFNLPEETVLARLQSLISKNKETDSCNCVKAAKKMGLPVDLEVYIEIADGLMKQANKQGDKYYRKKDVETACKLYKYLSAKHGIDTRDKIWKAWNAACSKSSCHTNPQSAIKAASEILNFKYIPRGWERILF